MEGYREKMMQENTSISEKLLVFISLMQGLMLLLLHQTIEWHVWPSQSPDWLYAFYSMAFVGPTMLLLSIEKQKEIALIKYIMPFTALVGLLGYYIGYQVVPASSEYIRTDRALSFAFSVTITIAAFKALMYIQQWVGNERFNYGHLFSRSWRNFLTLGLSLLFTLCFWGILMLWAALFKAIKINFFDDLFTEHYFIYPVLSLANGLGLILFRKLSNIIDMVMRLQQALMKFLLVLLVLVSILFLGALPFSGLKPLWESGGSHLILWMQLLILFFINMVYQNNSDERPYPLWLHRFIYMGVALLPIYSVISFYGLSLRVDQYGWSLSRCWGMLTWLLLALFSVGYFWGILKRRDHWLTFMGQANVVMGLVVLVCMLLVNSPLLDFRKITVASQLNRLETKKIMPDDFDVQYFYRDLSRPGYLALQTLKTAYAESNPKLVIKINLWYSNKKRKDAVITKEELLAEIQMISGELPDLLGDAIYRDLIENQWSIQYTKQYYLLPLDLNGDTQKEYLFYKEQKTSGDLSLYYFEANQWKKALVSRYASLDERTLSILKAGDIQVVKPKWQEFKIGEHQFHVE